MYIYEKAQTQCQCQLQTMWFIRNYQQLLLCSTGLFWTMYLLDWIIKNHVHMIYFLLLAGLTRIAVAKSLGKVLA